MLRGRPLSKKTGNIYYDLKVSTIRKDDTFFAGEPVVTITRGKKFLQSKVSVDICEEIVKRKQEDIFDKEWLFYAGLVRSGFEGGNSEC